MAKAAFLFLRILTAIAVLGALTGTVLAILVTSAFTLLEDSATIFVVLAKLVTSGFRDGGSASPNERTIALPLVGLAILFLTMLTSVFTPGQKIFFHVVAAMSVAAAAWQIWIMVQTPGTPMLYLPVIALWFLYYAVCLRRL
jgi:hypothetical protein